MLNNLFGGDDNNMILIIILIFLLLGGGDIFGGDCKDRDRDRCNDGLFGGLLGGDNIIWILILLFFIGDIF